MLPAHHSLPAFGCSRLALHASHENVFDKTALPLRLEAANWARGISMKKIYEKPVLVKRQKLSSVVAGSSAPLPPR